LRLAEQGIIAMPGLFRRRSVFAALSLLVSLWLPPAEGAYQVTGISFSRSPGEMRVSIRADGPVQYDFFTMNETRPQLIVDLADAVHALDRRRFQPPSTDIVERVRTSQYRPYPHPVVRVVLDLHRLTPFKMIAAGRELIIAVTPPADGRPVTDDEGARTDIPEERTSPPRETPQTSAAPPEAPPEDLTAHASATGSAPPEIPPAVPSLAEPAVTESVSTAPEQAAEDTAASGGEMDPLLVRLMALGIREPVSYTNGGRRDPFVPLPAQQEVEFGQAPLPDVEKLSIVGILQGIDGYRALAQDDDDNGYVLRKGDRVLYGYVARIEAERVIFYLNRRGLDRTVILKIPQ